MLLSNEELERVRGIDYKDFVTRSDKAKEVVQEIIEQAEEEVGYKPPKYAFDLQIMMLPDEGLVLVLSEKEPLENKSGAQLLQALQEMKRVFEEKKAEIGAAEKKAQAGENAGESGKKNKKAAEAQKPQFAIFAFRNIGRVIEYAAVLPTNLRIDSTLYRMEDGTCYAYVRKGGASYERYSRACIQAMEFAALYAADEQKLRYLEEHGECLIRERKKRNENMTAWYSGYRISAISSGRGAVNCIFSPVMGWTKDSFQACNACRCICSISGLYR